MKKRGSNTVQRMTALFLVFLLIFQAADWTGISGLFGTAEATEVLFYDVETAAEFLRQGLKNREETITLTYVSNSYNSTMTTTIMDEALAHTRVGDEGDYIARQISAWSTAGSHRTVDNTWCYQTIIYMPTYLTTAEQEAEFTEKLETVMAELDLDSKTEYEKIRAIYDYICENVTYDYDHVGDYDYGLQWTAYAALIDRTAVCEGYSLLFYRMALEAGLDARCVAGTAGSSAHMWNIVGFGDSYYQVDATWDAAEYQTSGTYFSFMKGTDSFTSHVFGGDYASDEFLAAYPLAKSDYTEGVVASGEFEEALTWTFSGDGTLVIGGTGSMPDYSTYSDAPWYQYRSEITSVEIDDGVTYVGSNAFTYYSHVRQVTIGSGVRTIAFTAFFREPWLEQFEVSSANTSYSSVDGVLFDKAQTTLIQYPMGKEASSYAVPAGVTEIAEAAFYYCTNLEEITLPEGLITVNVRAFWFCEALRRLNLPASLVDFDEALLYNSSLEALYVAEGSAHYSSVDGVLFDAAMTSLLCYPQAKTGSSYQVPDGVTTIGRYAFSEGLYLEDVTLPDTVAAVEDYAFSHNTSLAAVTFEGDAPAFGSLDSTIFSNVTAIVYYPAENSTWTDSVMLDYGGTLVWRSEDSRGKALAGGACGDAATWTLAEDGTLTVSGTGLLEGYVAGAFASSSTWRPFVKNAVIGEGITGIDDQSFYCCENLETVTIPDSVTSIGNKAFYECSALTGVAIPDGVTGIGEQAFAWCTSLTTVGIPEAVTEIGAQAFIGCTSLASAITIPGGAGEIGAQTFYGCESLTMVTIQDGVTAIGDRAFYGCTSLTAVIIPESVADIGTDVFKGCDGLTIYGYAGSEAETYAAQNVIEFVDITEEKEPVDPAEYYEYELLEDGTIRITAYTGDEIIVSIPATIDGYAVTVIGEKAFYEMEQIVILTIPEGVTEVEDQAFRRCRGISVLNLPDSLAVVGTLAFWESEIADLYIPSGLVSIGTRAFENQYLETITVAEDNIAYVSVDNILYTKDMTELVRYPSAQEGETCEIPEGVTSIAAGAFYDSILTDISLPSTLTDIGEQAFYGCYYLDNVVVPEGVEVISDTAFGGCNRLTNISLPSTLTTLESCAFFSCIALTEIEIPEGVTTIGDKVFYYCKGLEKVLIPASVTSMGTNVFLSCGSSLAIYGYAGSTAESYASKNKHTFVNLYEYYYDFATGVTVERADGSLFTEDELPAVTDRTEEADSLGLQAGAIYEICMADAEGNETAMTSAVQVTVPVEEEIILTEIYRVNEDGTLTSMEAEMEGDTLIFETSEAGVFAAITEEVEYEYYLRDENTVYLYRYLGSDTDLVLPEKLGRATVTEIGGSLFEGADYSTGEYWVVDFVETVTIPATVTSIWGGPFTGNINGLKEIFVEEGNTAYCSVDGVLFDRDMTTLVAYPVSKEGTTYTIPASVTEIGEYAFANNRNLTEMEIPDSVSILSYLAFWNCSALQSVTLPDEMASMGEGLFRNCVSLSSVQMPSVVDSFGAYIFESCVSLTEIEMPENLTEIPIGMFYGCTALSGVTIPESVTAIGQYAFRYCVNITGMKFSENLLAIGLCAFEGCTGLTRIVIPEQVKYLWTGTFNDCSNLKTAVIYSSSLFITYDFEGCSSDLIIYGYLNSTSQEYAENSGITFVDLESLGEADLSYILEVATVSDTLGTLMTEAAGKIAAGSRRLQQLIFNESWSGELMADAAADAEGDKVLLLQPDPESGTSYELALTDSSLIGGNGTVTFSVTDSADGLLVYGYNGDVTGDGVVNASDTLAILRGVSGRTSLDEVEKGFADVNLDGTVNSNDLLAVVKYVSGRTSTLN